MGGLIAITETIQLASYMARIGSVKVVVYLASWYYQIHTVKTIGIA